MAKQPIQPNQEDSPDELEQEYDPDNDTEQSGILSVAMDVRQIKPDLVPGPVPRKVPIPLQARIYFGSAVIQGAWLILAASMLLVWYWLPFTDLTSWYHFGSSAKTVIVSGEVKRVEQFTGFKGTRDGQIVELSKVTYTYQGARGTPHEKSSFESVAYTAKHYEHGDFINTVEYLPDAPYISKIPDALQKPYGPAKAIIVIIPALCLIIILAHMASAFRHLRLLSHGQIALSQVKHTEKAMNKAIKKLQFRYTLQFIAKDGKRYKSRCFSDRPSVNNPDSLPVLYNTAKPGRSATLLDVLPGNPILTTDGFFKDRGHGILYLLLPLLTFLLNLAAGIWVMTQ
jgi:hypothetical protein